MYQYCGISQTDGYKLCSPCTADSRGEEVTGNTVDTEREKFAMAPDCSMCINGCIMYSIPSHEDHTEVAE